MSELALIEIAAGSDPRDQQDMLSFAYRVSRTGRVLLLLNGVTRRQADRWLDRVVREEGLDVAGLLYVDASDEDAVLRLAGAARAVVAVSQGLRALLERSGIRPLSPEQLLQEVGAARTPARRTVRRAPAALSCLTPA